MLCRCCRLFVLQLAFTFYKFCSFSAVIVIFPIITCCFYSFTCSNSWQSKYICWDSLFYTHIWNIWVNCKSLLRTKWAPQVNCTTVAKGFCVFFLFPVNVSVGAFTQRTILELNQCQLKLIATQIWADNFSRVTANPPPFPLNPHNPVNLPSCHMHTVTDSFHLLLRRRRRRIFSRLIKFCASPNK